MSAYINYWPPHAATELGIQQGTPLKKTRVLNPENCGLRLGAYLYVIAVHENSLICVGRMIVDEFRLNDGVVRPFSLTVPPGEVEIHGIGGGTLVRLDRVLSKHQIEYIETENSRDPAIAQRSAIRAGYAPYEIRRISSGAAIFLDNVIDLEDA
jgi:hypothetical protein